MSIIIKTSITTKRLAEVLESILPVARQFSDSEVIKAGIALAIIGQKPGLTVKELIPLIEDISDYVALQVVETEDIQ